MLRKILFTSYILVVACMAAATFVEKYHGTDFTHAAVYGSWWFTALWTLLAAAAVAYFVGRRIRRPSAVALHASFVLILAGALATVVLGVLRNTPLLMQLFMVYFAAAPVLGIGPFWAAVLSLDIKGTVIATGGSVVYSEKAMRHLKSGGTVIYLHLSLE